MDAAEPTIAPDLGNLVRLADHFIDKTVKLTNDAVIGARFDSVTCHIAAKKAKELINQIKLIIQ